MQCSQCSRPAVFQMGGHYLCADHAALVANVQSSQNDTIRLMMAMMNDAENSIEASFGLAPRRPMQIPPRQIVRAQHTTVNDNRVHIDRSTVGVVNTGAIGTLNASVSLIQQSDPEVAEQIKTLIETVSRSQELEQEARKEIIEQVSYLLGQMSVPSAQRNPSVLKTIFGSIGTTLSTSADLYTLWEALHPVLVRLLG